MLNKPVELDQKLHRKKWSKNAAGILLAATYLATLQKLET